MSNIYQTEELIGKWPYPIAFLEDYMKFAINIRPLSIKMIVKNHNETTNDNEKKLLFYLGVEQFFFLHETLLAFYGAETSDVPVDLYYWLTEDFSELNLKTRLLNEKQLEHIYKSAMPELDKATLKQFIDNSVEIAKYMKKLSPVTECLIPLFNKLKHKFLYYRHNDGIYTLVSEQVEKELLKLLGSIESNNTAQDMFSFIELVEQTKMLIENAIYIIIFRLQTEGPNKWVSGPGENAELFTPRSPQFS